MNPSSKHASFYADAEISHLTIAINVEIQRLIAGKTTTPAQYWSARLTEVSRRHNLLAEQWRKIEALQARLRDLRSMSKPTG